MKYLPTDLSPTKIKNELDGETQHLYKPEDIVAINAALAINRPLLIFGEPGIGKSQLAKAVAHELGRVFLPFVCDAHTESRDLLWQFDAVERLADAQVQGTLPIEERNDLSVKNYIVPQSLWWGLNWNSALSTTKGKNSVPIYDEENCNPEKGCVILIDEIDKAATAVPNGLLEVLGDRRFQPQGMEAVCSDPKGVAPLVIISSNDERKLPNAFIRRCLVLHLDFPKIKNDQINFLVERGTANFPTFAKLSVKNDQNEDCSLLRLAAEMLVVDRAASLSKHLYPLPGQAEYFDLLRAVQELHAAGRGEPQELLSQLRPYTLDKVRERS